MKKVFKATASLICIPLLLIAGCSTTKKDDVTSQVAECYWPDGSKAAAPLWVCDGPVDGVAVSATGSSEKSGAGYQFMKDIATASAREELAKQLSVRVQAMIKRYVETTGAASAETVDRVNTAVSKQITNESVSGSRIYRTATSPNGMVFVLVGLDAKMAQEAAKVAIQTSMKNERAAWQRLNAKKAQDELADEIVKLQSN